jgi:hypothetical protein
MFFFAQSATYITNGIKSGYSQFTIIKLTKNVKPSSYYHYKYFQILCHFIHSLNKRHIGQEVNYEQKLLHSFPCTILFVCCEENYQSSGMECVSCLEDIKLSTQSCNT